MLFNLIKLIEVVANVLRVYVFLFAIITCDDEMLSFRGVLISGRHFSMLSRGLPSCCRCEPAFRALAVGFTPALQAARPIQTHSYLRLCAPFKPQWEQISRTARLRAKNL